MRKKYTRFKQIVLFFLHSDALKFTNKSANRIGKVYKKAIYREFTNSTFTEQKPHDEKMGILGPVLRGQRGDVIQIYFKVVYKSVTISQGCLHPGQKGLSSTTECRS